VKILIDSGNCKNLGDNAMIFNVLNYLEQHIEGVFYVVDRGVPLDFTDFEKRIIMVKRVNPLLQMPHWRIQCYRDQPWFYKYICVFLSWFITISRALKMVTGILFYKRYKRHLFSNQDIRYWVEMLNTIDAYWVVGGGYINDMWLEAAFWKMIFARICKIQGKPVIFSGQGLGPINRLSSKLVVQFGVKSMSLLSLRERVSFNNLKKLSVNLKKCHVVGDDALTIPDSTNEKSISLPGKFIAMNIRFSDYSFQDQNLFKKCVHLVELCMKRYPEHQIVFIPIAFNKKDSDIDSAEKILQRIGKYKERVTILKREDVSIQNIKLILKHASLSIGISYHFCLFSLLMGGANSSPIRQ